MGGEVLSQVVGEDGGVEPCALVPEVLVVFEVVGVAEKQPLRVVVEERNAVLSGHVFQHGIQVGIGLGVGGRHHECKPYVAALAQGCKFS